MNALAMNTTEARRFALRTHLFFQRGRNEQEAADLARRCLLRDRPDGYGKDGRHFCPECAHWQPFGKCRVDRGGTIPWNVAHNCHLFAWQVPDGANAKNNEQGVVHNV